MRKTKHLIAAALALLLVFGCLPQSVHAHEIDIERVRSLIPKELDRDSLEPIQEVLPRGEAQLIPQQTPQTQSLPQKDTPAQPASTPVSGKCGPSLTWTLEEGTLTISGTGNMYDYSPDNPAPWYEKRRSIFNIEIEVGVTSIGAYAFKDITRMLDCDIPSTVKTVGTHAYDGIDGGCLYFQCDPPVFAADALAGFSRTICYFGDWDAAALQSYGGDPTWKKGQVFILRHNPSRLFPLNHTFTADDFMFSGWIGYETVAKHYSPRQVEFGSYDNSTYGQKTITMDVDGYNLSYTYFVTDGTNHLELVDVEFEHFHEYTSGRITPQPVITIGDLELQHVVDYDLEFKNNHDPSTDATVTITGKGILEGYQKTLPFAILKRDLSRLYIMVEDMPFVGLPLAPEVSVCESTGSIWDNHYEIQYSNNVNIGSATVRAVGKDNNYGMTTQEFQIGFEPTDVVLPGTYNGQADGNLNDEIYYAEGFMTPGVFTGTIDTYEAHIANYMLYRIDGEEPELIYEYKSPYGKKKSTYFTYDFSDTYNTVTEAGGVVYMLVYTWVTDSYSVYSGACVLMIPTKVPEATMAAIEQAEDGDFRREYLNLYGEDGNIGVPTWRSSNSSVATVTDGVVTLKTPGNITITASYGGVEVAKQLTVTALSLADGEIFLYAPESKTVYVIYDNRLLEKGTDYTVSTTESNGCVTVTVTGKGLFTGQLMRQFDSLTGEALEHCHSFHYTCDSTCNRCDFTRDVSHRFDSSWKKDLEAHWHACTVCGEKKDEALHTLSADGSECNICGVLYTPGDLNCDFTVNEDDAIYLLQHILLPDFFPIQQAADYNGDGTVNEDDAIYLLQHVLLPDFFPLR